MGADSLFTYCLFEWHSILFYKLPPMNAGAYMSLYRVHSIKHYFRIHNQCSHNCNSHIEHERGILTMELFYDDFNIDHVKNGFIYQALISTSTDTKLGTIYTQDKHSWQKGIQLRLQYYIENKWNC